MERPISYTRTYIHTRVIGDTVTQRTPLYDRHVELGGKIVEFGGFELPIQYPSGVTKEHMAVREQAGLFDVSHMGEFIIEGPGAAEYLEHILTNVYDNLAVGRVRYGILCDEDGGVLDDLIVYRLGDEKFMAVPNAANRAQDFEWFEAHLPESGVTLTDVSDETGLLALQGPASKEILSSLVDEELLPAKYYSAVWDVPLLGAEVIISRTGYTGEFGYEIYVPAEHTVAVWDALLEAGAEHGLIPCALGARDTLRLEAGMPLYGHEMDTTTTPLETDLGFAVKMDKPDFIGKAGIEAALPLTRKRVGLEVEGKGIVREHSDLFVGDEQVGRTTSGTKVPYLGKAVAMGYVDIAHAEVGTALEADVRGKRVPVEVVALPFYKAN